MTKTIQRLSILLSSSIVKPNSKLTSSKMNICHGYWSQLKWNYTVPYTDSVVHVSNILSSILFQISISELKYAWIVLIMWLLYTKRVLQIERRKKIERILSKERRMMEKIKGFSYSLFTSIFSHQSNDFCR